MPRDPPKNPRGKSDVVSQYTLRHPKRYKQKSPRRQTDYKMDTEHYDADEPTGTTEPSTPVYQDPRRKPLPRGLIEIIVRSKKVTTDRHNPHLPEDLQQCLLEYNERNPTEQISQEDLELALYMPDIREQILPDGATNLDGPQSSPEVTSDVELPSLDDLDLFPEISASPQVQSRNKSPPNNQALLDTPPPETYASVLAKSTPESKSPSTGSVTNETDQLNESLSQEMSDSLHIQLSETVSQQVTQAEENVASESMHLELIESQLNNSLEETQQSVAISETNLTCYRRHVSVDSFQLENVFPQTSSTTTTPPEEEQNDLFSQQMHVCITETTIENMNYDYTGSEDLFNSQSEETHNKSQADNLASQQYLFESQPGQLSFQAEETTLSGAEDTFTTAKYLTPYPEARLQDTPPSPKGEKSKHPETPEAAASILRSQDITQELAQTRQVVQEAVQVIKQINQNKQGQQRTAQENADKMQKQTFTQRNVAFTEAMFTHKPEVTKEERKPQQEKDNQADTPKGQTGIKRRNRPHNLDLPRPTYNDMLLQSTPELTQEQLLARANRNLPSCRAEEMHMAGLPLTPFHQRYQENQHIYDTADQGEFQAFTYPDEDAHFLRHMHQFRQTRDESSQMPHFARETYPDRPPAYTEADRYRYYSFTTIPSGQTVLHNENYDETSIQATQQTSMDPTVTHTTPARPIPPTLTTLLHTDDHKTLTNIISDTIDLLQTSQDPLPPPRPTSQLSMHSLSSIMADHQYALVDTFDDDNTSSSSDDSSSLTDSTDSSTTDTSDDSIPVINAITTRDDLDDFNDLTLADMSSEGQHLTILKQRLTIMRQQLQVHKLALQTLVADHGPIESIQNDEVRRKIMHTHKNRILRLKGHILKYSKAIEEAELVQSRFQTNLDIPKDTGRDVTFHIRDLTAAVPHCTNTDGISNFAVVYSKLITYGTMKAFSHENYKQAIKLLLNDPSMIETFARNEHKSFPEIVALFKDLYVSSKTILDYSNQLDTFSRQPGETLRTALARFSQLLHETEHLHPIHQRATRKEIETEQLLFNISSPKASAHLKEIKARAQTRGLPISTRQYLEAAEEAEYIYKDVPLTATPNRSGPRPTVEQRHVPLFAIAAQTTTLDPKIAQQIIKPPLTGANNTPLGATTQVEQNVISVPPQRQPQICRYCGSPDPAHVWRSCAKNPRAVQNTAPKATHATSTQINTVACYKCGGTDKHTWNTCTRPRALQNKPQQGAPKRPCPKCAGTQSHDWKRCTGTPVATIKPQKQTNALQPCYRCGSNILHNWRECKGIPPSTPQTSQPCFKCGSNEYHKWNLCQGIPPNYLRDPEFMQFRGNTPLPQLQHIVYQQTQPQIPQLQNPQAVYQQAPRACFKCGSTAPHTWNTCTNPRMDGLPRTTLAVPHLRNDTVSMLEQSSSLETQVRACPHCSGTDRHDWKICGDTIAAVAALNLKS